MAMDRKTFLKNAAFASAGSLMIPALFASCDTKELFDASNYKGKIVIIGAGAAGLYAGYLLQKYGVNFEILEASNRHGGRLNKLSGFADIDFDLGAEWLHGRNSIIGDLIKESGTEIYKDNSDGKYFYKGNLVDDIPELTKLAENMEDCDQDISMKEYFYKNGMTDAEYNAICFLAGEYGASPEDLSMKWMNYEERNWSSGNTDYKFKETYFDFYDSVIVPSIKDKIRYRKHVCCVDYSGSEVIIHTHDEEEFKADHVILALPLPVLKDGDIDFTPKLPEKKTAAFQKIGMGSGMKVFLKFSDKFYDGGVIGGRFSPAYADEAYGKETNENVLMAFVMGNSAKYLSEQEEEDLVHNLLFDLSGIYGLNNVMGTYEDAYVQDWSKEPFVRGAYSYSTIGMRADTRTIAAEPVADKLFFAGEVMNLNGHHASVHGAAETGKREVERILSMATK